MRLRLSVRLRLTMLYGGLFLFAGALLLVVNYGLVRSRLPEPQHVTAAPAIERSVLPLEGPVGGAFDQVLPVDITTPEGRRIQDAFIQSAREYRQRTLDTLVVQSLAALGLMALVSIGLGWMVAGRVLRPLHRITAIARRLSEQNLHERIALEGPSDELKELADTFDDMLTRLSTAFDAQKRFIANASHELRTPLAIQRALVDVELAGPGRAPEDAATAEKLRHAIGRSERLIDSLLVLARSERRIEEWSPVELAGAAEQALDAVAGEVAAAELRVERRLGAATACGDPPLLERVVWNLVENAVRHNVAGGSIEVTTGEADGRAAVSVANTGPDIGPGEIARLFEPFRRLGGDRTRSVVGSGLGLSIVEAVVRAHGGQVWAASRPGGGLQVEVRLPTGSPGTRGITPG